MKKADAEKELEDLIKEQKTLKDKSWEYVSRAELVPVDINLKYTQVSERIKELQAFIKLSNE